jgi:hypothetical protein
VSAVESTIDDLYQVPLDEFTTARNALAKTLTGADAQRVKKLAKPTVVPWAVNQVYWKSRGTYDRLVKSERLREAQIGALEGRRSDVRAATDAHRKAMGAAVKEAERLAAAGGSRPAPDALMRTFEALSLMREPPDPPGRLTEALQPAGFEALAGVPVQHLPPSGTAAAQGHDAAREADGSSAAGVQQKAHVHAEPGGHADARTRRAREREEREARQRELAAAKEHDAAVKKAEAALAHAQGAETMAREALERAAGAVASAAANLKRLRSKTS